MNTHSRQASLSRNAVLIAVVKDRRDLTILRRHQWYRIPTESVPKKPFSYIAFYQPAVFGKDGKRITHYARVQNSQERLRHDLLPREPHHPRAHAPYAQYLLGPLRKLARPIINTLPRRISFGFTTVQKLLHARTILALYGVNDTESMLKTRMRRSRIRALPQHYACGYGRRYRLDFAVLCKRGNIAIECDNEKAHVGYRQRERDRQKDAFLRHNGWTVLRFSEPEIVRHGAACILHITGLVRRLGGLKD